MSNNKETKENEVEETLDNANVNEETEAAADVQDEAAADLFRDVRDTAILMRMVCLSVGNDTFAAFERDVDDDSDSFFWYLSMYAERVIASEFEYVIKTDLPENAQFAIAAAMDGGYSGHISLLMEWK